MTIQIAQLSNSYIAHLCCGNMQVSAEAPTLLQTLLAVHSHWLNMYFLQNKYHYEHTT